MSYPADKPIPYDLVLRARRTLSWPSATREDRRLARQLILEAEMRASSREFVPYAPTSVAIVERERPPEPRRGRFWLFGG